MHWTFIGAGNMASSLIGGWLAQGHPADSVTVIDPDQQTRTRCEQTHDVRGIESLADLPTGNAGVNVVIAVKPHIVKAVCEQLSAHIAARLQLVVSVAAGVRSASIARCLPDHTAIVRCMPNTPALLGLGATGVFANASCSDAQLATATALLDTAGMTVTLDNESQLDAVTALSGSGPAYAFYLIEQMAASGRELGLPESVARELAIETVFGAASMARERSVSPGQLRQNVTSKGGTTAAALAVFDEQGMPALIGAAMQAARQRAIDMGDELAEELAGPPST